MSWRALAALLWLAAAAAHAEQDAPVLEGPALGGIEIPGTRVRLELPLGFEVAKGFAGLIHHLSGTTVVVRELALPPQAVSRWLEREALEARGLRRTGAERLPLETGEAMVYRASEDREYSDRSHWISLFGDQTRSVMIVATVPNPFESHLGAEVMRVLGSARWDREKKIDPLEDLTFGVSETAWLQFAPRLSDRLVLVRRDQIGTLAGDDPRVFVSRHALASEVEDIERFALEHLAQSDQTSTLEHVSGARLRWAGLPAYEIVARGADFERLAPLLLYQMLALDGEHFYVLQGFVALAEEALYLPEFRAVVTSFRPSP